MGVDLCRRDIGMAEHLLHASQIGSMIEEMAGEGVAQHMRRQAGRVEPGSERQRLEQLAAALAGQMTGLAMRREQPARRLIARWTATRQKDGAACQIGRESLAG